MKTENKENAEEKSSAENVTTVQAESNVKEAETADPADTSASTSEPEELSAAAPSVTEKTEKISDKTEEKADEKGGSTKTRTEVYQHEKTTVTKSEGVPDEAEKQANKDEKGNEPVKKHVTETEKETWTETKTTTETTTKKASGDTQMTNADDYSQKSVYQIGSDGSAQKSDDNVSKKVKEFYDNQNITSDFAVYAGSLDGTIGHEDGNIAVDELNAGTTIMNKDGQYAMGSGLSLQDVGKAYANSGYSYINKTKDDQYINSSSNFQTGGTNDALVIYGPDEGNSHEDTDGTANHFRSVHTKKGEKISEKDKKRTATLEQAMKIRENLKKIGESGASVTAAVKDNLPDEQKLKAAVDIIKSGKLSKNDILTLNLSAHVLKNDGKAGEYNQVNNLLTALVNENRNRTNILISIEIPDDMLSGGKTLKDLWGMMNGIQNYDHKASYLTWNFGDFDGKIVIGNTVSGNFIAPNAALSVNGIESGRMVADLASHGGEIHMAVKGDYQKNYVTEKKTDTKTSESEHKKEKHTDVKYEYAPEKGGSETSSETHSQAGSQASSEAHSQATSEHASTATSEVHSQADSLASSETHSQATSEHASTATSEVQNQTYNEATSEVQRQAPSQTHTPSSSQTSVKTAPRKEAKSSSEEDGSDSAKKYNTDSNKTSASAAEEEDGGTEKGKYKNASPDKTEALSVNVPENVSHKKNVITDTYASGTEETQAEKGVETGDSTGLLGSLMSLFASGGVVAYLLGRKKKREK